MLLTSPPKFLKKLQFTVRGGRGATVWTVSDHGNWIHPKNNSGLVQSDGDMTGEIFLRHRVSLVWAPDVSDT